LTATLELEPITQALAAENVDRLIETALTEDVGAGDVTTDALIPMDMTCRGKIVCKEDGIIAGLSVAARVFAMVDERHHLRRQNQGWREGAGGPDRGRASPVPRAACSRPNGLH